MNKKLAKLFYSETYVICAMTFFLRSSTFSTKLETMTLWGACINCMSMCNLTSNFNASV